MDRPFVEQSAAEYFRELIEAALSHQRVDAGELTAYYLVNLLCGFVRADRSDGTSLGLNEWRSISGPIGMRTGIRDYGF